MKQKIRSTGGRFSFIYNAHYTRLCKICKTRERALPKVAEMSPPWLFTIQAFQHNRHLYERTRITLGVERSLAALIWTSRNMQSTLNRSDFRRSGPYSERGWAGNETPENKTVFVSGIRRKTKNGGSGEYP